MELKVMPKIWKYVVLKTVAHCTPMLPTDGHGYNPMAIVTIRCSQSKMENRVTHLRCLNCDDHRNNRIFTEKYERLVDVAPTDCFVGRHRNIPILTEKYVTASDG